MIKNIEKSKLYQSKLNEYVKLVKSFANSKVYENTMEPSFEALNDWSLFNILEGV